MEIKIPKKIHYCWFGNNPLPDMALKCISSWKKYCPDYEIIEWNESNFDVECCDYVREAYNEKKWAFVSDYARFKIIYDEGGIYFDTDVELLKSINPLIEKGGFMASESEHCDVAPGLGIAAPKGLWIYKEILRNYEQSNFITESGNIDLTTVVERTTRILENYGLQRQNIIQKVADLIIYPKEYFCPKDYETKKTTLTKNSYAIHHYDSSWHSDEQKYRNTLYINYQKFLPNKLAKKLARIVARIKYNGVLSVIIKL